MSKIEEAVGFPELPSGDGGPTAPLPATSEASGKMPDSLAFGVLAPTLTEQGWAPYLPAAELGRFELIARAISTCGVQGVISYTEKNRAYDKLSKRIQAAVIKHRPKATLEAEGSGSGDSGTPPNPPLAAAPEAGQ